MEPGPHSLPHPLTVPHPSRLSLWTTNLCVLVPRDDESPIGQRSHEGPPEVQRFLHFREGHHLLGCDSLARLGRLNLLTQFRVLSCERGNLFFPLVRSHARLDEREHGLERLPHALNFFWGKAP